MTDRRAPFSNVTPGEAVAEALANLRAQGQRSILALLGILIGTASIVAMLTIGHMAQRETLRLFEHLGVDMLQIHAMPAGAAPATLDRALIEGLPGRDPAVRAAASMAIDRAQIATERTATSLSIVAASAGLPALTGLRPAQGRFLAPVDDGGLVAVVGSEAARTLSVPGAPLTPGVRIRVRDYVYTVIGVLEPVPYTAMDPVDFNNSVIVPLTGAGRITWPEAPSTALLRLRSDAGPADNRRIAAALANPDVRLQVISAQDLIQSMNAQKAIHGRLLTAIGAISLLVGGIGVMNVMLMGVMERRREIGLRAAIGATPRDLRIMFLVEAATLAFVGGLAGLGLGLAAAAAVAALSGWTFSLPLYVLVLGPGLAAGVGVAFGFYPAARAARLDPIAALRAD